MLMLDLLAVVLVTTVRCLLLVYHSLATVMHCVMYMMTVVMILAALDVMKMTVSQTVIDGDKRTIQLPFNRLHIS